MKKSSRRNKKIHKVVAKGDVTQAEQQIAILVKRVRDYDSEIAFIELKGHLQPYIKLFGKKYRIPGCDSDEIEQECLFALRYKAIEDFNPKRGKFQSFAILCIKRHLFSLIKGNSQQKRRALNESISLNDDHSDDGENLSLASLICDDEDTIGEQIADVENEKIKHDKLIEVLSPLEREVFKYYILKYHYDEIVDELKEVFPEKNINRKLCDNALVRIRSKAQNLSKNLDWS